MGLALFVIGWIAIIYVLQRGWLALNALKDKATEGSNSGSRPWTAVMVVLVVLLFLIQLLHPFLAPP